MDHPFPEFQSWIADGWIIIQETVVFFFFCVVYCAIASDQLLGKKECSLEWNAALLLWEKEFPKAADFKKTFRSSNKNNIF